MKNLIKSYKLNLIEALNHLQTEMELSTNQKTYKILDYSNMFMEKEVYRIHAEMCKVFSNPTRLEILNLIRDKEMSVTELIVKTKLNQANISQHLSIMKSKDIVSSNRNGKNIYYKLANPKIIKAFDMIREILIERLKKNGKIIGNL